MPPDKDPWKHGPQNFPTDIVPLQIYALAKCWHQHSAVTQAHDAIKRTVDLISQEKKLSGLRQNLYQECARYYWETELFDLANDMLERQLSIVKSKGSRVLINHVLTNWLINKGNLHCQRQEYADANRYFKEALALFETAWDPNPRQIEWLQTSLKKLDGHIQKGD